MLKFSYAEGEQPLAGYTLRKPLGHGGFGEVYHAVSDAGKDVALKLVQRFLEVELRGVRHCLNLKHPNLVTIYDLRTSETGEHWVVLEYVDGETLADRLDRHPQGLPENEVLGWLEGIAAGMGYLHEKGLVHRDLKPGNVFIEDGTVKVGDYGLSKFITTSKRSGQTQSVGTLHYMAPEIGSGCYGPEVDVYALGVILYEMLTGNVPFEGETPAEILMKHLNTVPDLSALPHPYRAVVGKMLAKRPADRHATMDEVLTDLRRRHGEPDASPSGYGEPDASASGYGEPDASASGYGEPDALASGYTPGGSHPWLAKTAAMHAHGAVDSAGPAAFRQAGATSGGVLGGRHAANTFSGLIPSGARPIGTAFHRIGKSLREHPILWPLCLFLSMALILIAAGMDHDFGIFGGRLFPRGVVDDPDILWGYMGLGALLCVFASVVLFGWRTIVPAPAMLARRQRVSSSQAPGLLRRWGRSLREHPVLWSILMIPAWASTGFVAYFLGWLAGVHPRRIGDVVMVPWTLCVVPAAMLFSAGLFVWRTLAPTERMLSGQVPPGPIHTNTAARWSDRFARFSLKESILAQPAAWSLGLFAGLLIISSGSLWLLQVQGVLGFPGDDFPVHLAITIPTALVISLVFYWMALRAAGRPFSGLEFWGMIVAKTVVGLVMVVTVCLLPQQRGGNRPSPAGVYFTGHCDHIGCYKPVSVFISRQNEPAQELCEAHARLYALEAHNGGQQVAAVDAETGEIRSDLIDPKATRSTASRTAIGTDEGVDPAPVAAAGDESPP